MKDAYSILFVDDEPAILEAIYRGFRKTPFSVFTAIGGAEALTIMQSETIDIIVADHDMPQMKGSELLRICRARWPDCIRIMLTGGGNLEVALNATFGGWVYQYLEKPVKISELRHIIEEALLLFGVHVNSEYARLLVAPEVRDAITIHRRLTASPERPTFAADATALEWALELCETNTLPPELDRLRPLIEVLHEISQMVNDDPGEKSCEEVVNQIQLLIRCIC